VGHQEYRLSHGNGWLIAAAATAMLIASNPMAAAQEKFPSKQVTMVVPFAAGGVADLVGRAVAASLAATWNVPVIIDNRPGAGGAIGMGALARSRPDGQTIGMTVSSTLTLNPFVIKELPYDPLKDFVPVTNIGNFGLIFIGGKDFAEKDLKTYLSAARDKPNTITLGYTSTVSRLIVAMLADVLVRHLAEFRPVAVGAAQTSLLSGIVNSLVDQSASAAPLLQAGTANGIAVTTKERSPKFPGVPSLSEVIPGFEVVSWYGFFVPAGTPADRVDTIQKAIVQSLQDARVKDSLAQCECQPVGNSSAEFAAALKAEYERNKAIAEKYKLVD
jgi:tripartite-type tricarboxylate transporter receptor subunit TctC